MTWCAGSIRWLALMTFFSVRGMEIGFFNSSVMSFKCLCILSTFDAVDGLRSLCCNRYEWPLSTFLPNLISEAGLFTNLPAWEELFFGLRYDPGRMSLTITKLLSLRSCEDDGSWMALLFWPGRDMFSINLDTFDPFDWGLSAPTKSTFPRLCLLVSFFLADPPYTFPLSI